MKRRDDDYDEDVILARMNSLTGAEQNIIDSMVQKYMIPDQISEWITIDAVARYLYTISSSTWLCPHPKTFSRFRQMLLALPVQDLYVIVAPDHGYSTRPSEAKTLKRVTLLNQLRLVLLFRMQRFRKGLQLHPQHTACCRRWSNKI